MKNDYIDAIMALNSLSNSRITDIVLFKIITSISAKGRFLHLTYFRFLFNLLVKREKKTALVIREPFCSKLEF